MKQHGSVAIFEAQASLYCKRHGRLAPGKSEPMETGADSGDDENRLQFDNWKAIHAYVDALNHICTLQKAIEEVDSLLDTATCAWNGMETGDAVKEASAKLAPYLR